MADHALRFRSFVTILCCFLMTQEFGCRRFSAGPTIKETTKFYIGGDAGFGFFTFSEGPPQRMAVFHIGSLEDIPAGGVLGASFTSPGALDARPTQGITIHHGLQRMHAEYDRVRGVLRVGTTEFFLRNGNVFAVRWPSGRAPDVVQLSAVVRAAGIVDGEVNDDLLRVFETQFADASKAERAAVRELAAKALDEIRSGRAATTSGVGTRE